MRLGDLDALKEHAQKLLVGESINTYFGINLYKMFEEIIDNAPTVEERSYEEGFRDGYSQCITDNEERRENNRLFQKGGKEE